MTVYIVGAHKNLNLEATRNISMKDFVSMFISTLEDNLELKHNGTKLVDELLIINSDKSLNWRKKITGYFNALLERKLLAEYVIDDIKKHLI